MDSYSGSGGSLQYRPIHYEKIKCHECDAGIIRMTKARLLDFLGAKYFSKTNFFREAMHFYREWKENAGIICDACGGQGYVENPE